MRLDNPRREDVRSEQFGLPAPLFFGWRNAMKRCQLLIANTDRKMAGLYNQYFSNAGYRVNIASDAIECVNRLRRDQPDLLLLDQDLSSGGGNAVLACLRAEVGLSRVPVVLLTDLIPIHALSHLTDPPVLRYFGRHCPLVSLRYCIDSALASTLKAPRKPRAARVSI
jgi:CheY-like chemotaxis protein